jgi:uncharacterized membrane protein
MSMLNDYKAKPFGTKALIAAFLVSGTFHLVYPSAFYPLIPDFLGNKTAWAMGSGVLELVCAVGLLLGTRWAPRGTAYLLLFIWAGNFWYAYDSLDSGNVLMIIAAIVRLPFQIPMIGWAVASPVKAN